MDINGMVQALEQHSTPLMVVFFVLWVVSEILGSNDSIKASGIYGIVKAVLMTLKDQIFPMKTTS